MNAAQKQYTLTFCCFRDLEEKFKKLKEVHDISTDQMKKFLDGRKIEYTKINIGIMVDIGNLDRKGVEDFNEISEMGVRLFDKVATNINDENNA